MCERVARFDASKTCTGIVKLSTDSVISPSGCPRIGLAPWTRMTDTLHLTPRCVLLRTVAHTHFAYICEWIHGVYAWVYLCVRVSVCQGYSIRCDHTHTNTHSLIHTRYNCLRNGPLPTCVTLTTRTPLTTTTKCLMRTKAFENGSEVRYFLGDCGVKPGAFVFL